MTNRKRTTLTVVLTVAVLVLIAGIAWATDLFPDVSDDNVHSDAIEWAATNQIVEGYEDGNFGPWDEILRGQAASILMRYDDYLRDSLDTGGNGGNGMEGDCSACHDAGTTITGKQTSWSDSQHGTYESYVRAAGYGGSCAGCHSGGAFSDMVAEGSTPATYGTVDDDPTRVDCRACHMTHESYTEDDWALETTDPVALDAFDDVTYDGGTGNLCTNCHQPRRQIDAAVDGEIEITSTHWGPHHGPQSAMLLGLGGAGGDEGAPIEGSPMAHYSAVGDTCVTCHLSGTRTHTFEPDVEACQPCHAGAEDFDIGGVQSEVQADLDEIETELIDQGLLDSEGHPAVQSVDADKAAALWNWIYVAHEDESLGVHNPAYTRTLIQEAKDALGLE